MVDLTTRKQLMEKYGVDEEFIDETKYRLGECRRWLQDHESDYEDMQKKAALHKKDLKRANKKLRELRKLQDAANLLFETPYLDESSDNFIGYYFPLGHLGSVAAEFAYMITQLVDDIDFHSVMVNTSESYIEHYESIQNSRDVHIENLMKLGAYDS